MNVPETYNVNLSSPGKDTFDGQARTAASIVARGRPRNRPSQLRRFYDEVIHWEQSCRDDESVRRNLPMIRMLRAKVVYSRAREHVNEDYEALIGHLLDQVADRKTLRNARLFLEAFTGFYKAEWPQD